MFKLFLTFLKIGSVTFGGGYAMIPLIEEEIVNKQELLSEDDFLDYVSIAQSFPGAIAVNIALLLGYRFYKILGSLICLLGVILPSFLSILLLAYLYNISKNSNYIEGFFYGVRPVVVSLLLYSFFRMFKNMDKSKIYIIFFITSFILVTFFSVNPIYIILIGGIIGLCIKS
ncbi:chromate transporter [Tepidibacter formicigenes]|jgi:chromate transporter|uniref:Chromate transporter n=1 Tax=Tepidibacter formicigenes DSM 15518 TaxID=1123349 RepID=A0A1M6MFV5_9FIRM|nr:chromate transporter [Tepidibacter formicigenes]SHJ82246.1 chromate transporter [Tepidibacter formicigenes DSM 15518]